MVKDEFLRCRLHADERAVLVALAERERLNLSEAMRLAIRRAAREAGLWPPSDTGEVAS